MPGRVFYLALGGIHTEKTECVSGVSIVKSRWRRMLSVVSEARQSVLSGSSKNHAAIRRVLEDTVKAFEMHGYVAVDWFETWPRDDHDFNKDCYTAINQWALNWKDD